MHFAPSHFWEFRGHKCNAFRYFSEELALWDAAPTNVATQLDITLASPWHHLGITLASPWHHLGITLA
jgi:hypothetical protein